MGPMTKEQADEAVAKMQSSMEAHGWWNKICNTCNGSVGGRLAQYGKPTEGDMKYLACPVCEDTSKGFRVEFEA